MASTEFTDDFDAAGLDTGAWIPHYLPMWSSRAASAATYAVAGSELRLTIPPEHGLWCPGDHEPAEGLGHPVGRVLGAGRQHGRPAAVPRRCGRARVPAGAVGLDAALRAARGARADGAQPALDGRGVDGRPGGRAGRAAAEICIFEVFGDALRRDGAPTAAVGMGVHPFRDPAITDEFAAERVAIDVTEFHVYAADWRPGRVDFLIDGEPVKSVQQAPDYPMQMMVAVFDFPDKGAEAPPDHVPRLAVDWVRGGA